MSICLRHELLRCANYEYDFVYLCIFCNAEKYAFIPDTALDFDVKKNGVWRGGTSSHQPQLPGISSCNPT